MMLVILIKSLALPVILSSQRQSFPATVHSKKDCARLISILLCDCCFNRGKIPVGCFDVNHNHTVKEAEMKDVWEPSSFTLEK